MLPHTEPQSLLREDDIASLHIFTFLNRIKHIVFNGVLSFQLKDEAVLQFKGFLGVLAWNLELGVRLFDFIDHHLETLRRHHEGLLSLLELLRGGVLIDGEIIVNLIFLFFEVFFEVSIILSPQRNHHSCLSFILLH